jgi:hypothetical protein
VPPALLACSIVVSTESQQCKVDGDCTAHGFSNAVCAQSVCVTRANIDGGGGSGGSGGGGTGGDAAVEPWSCIGNVTWPSEDPAQMVNFRGRYLSAFDETPIVGLSVKACEPYDLDCAMSKASGTTDKDGYVNLSLPKNFKGFLSTQAPGVVPGIGYILPPQSKSDALDAVIPTNVAVHLITEQLFNGLLNQVKQMADPTMGHLFGLAVNCNNEVAEHVSITAAPTSPATFGYYSASDGFPSVTLKETSTKGEAGFINLPSGSVTVTATSNDVMKKLGDYAVFIKAGTITYLPLPPAP